MKETYETDELEEVANELVGNWSTNLFGETNETDYDIWIGRPEDKNDLKQASRFSCLEGGFEEVLQDNNIHYTLISIEGVDEDFVGYLRSYDLDKNGENVRAVATIQGDYQTESCIKGTKEFEMALAFEYLEAVESGADRFAIADKGVLPELKNQKTVEEDAQLLGNPLKDTYDVEEERNSVEINQSRISSTKLSLSNSSISS